MQWPQVSPFQPSGFQQQFRLSGPIILGPPEPGQGSGPGCARHRAHLCWRDPPCPSLWGGPCGTQDATGDLWVRHTPGALSREFLQPAKGSLWPVPTLRSHPPRVQSPILPFENRAPGCCTHVPAVLSGAPAVWEQTPWCVPPQEQSTAEEQNFKATEGLQASLSCHPYMPGRAGPAAPNPFAAAMGLAGSKPVSHTQASNPARSLWLPRHLVIPREPWVAANGSCLVQDPPSSPWGWSISRPPCEEADPGGGSWVASTEPTTPG